MTRKTAVLPLLAVALTGGLVTGTTAMGAAKKKTIQVDDDFFSPGSGKVKKGTTLVFKWVGDSTHNVVVTGAANKESKFQTTGTFSVKLGKKGKVNFLCEIHEGMKGSLKVK